MSQQTFIQFGQTVEELEKLKKYPETILTEPIAKGKWSIREIVGHMFYWDQFNLAEMVPYMSHGAKLPSFPDYDAKNREAVAYIDRFDSVASIIDAFGKTRKQLIESISQIDDTIQFTMGNEPHELSTESFVNIFVEHDSHHLKQIQTHLDRSFADKE